MLEEHGNDQDSTLTKPAGRNSASATGVLFVSGEIAHSDALIGALHAQGVEPVSTLEELAERLGKGPEVRGLVLYANPTMDVAARLEHGASLTSTLEDWRAHTAPVLEVFRADRRRVTLVDGHAAVAAPEEFQEHLARRVEIHSRESGPSPGPAPDPEAGVLHLLAAQALRQHEEAARLINELEASSLPLGAAPRIDLAALVEEWAGQSPSPEAEPGVDIEELKAENELLSLQLHQVHEELEATFVENRKLRKRMNEGREQPREATPAILPGLQQERDALAKDLKWAREDLDNLRGSLSWRLTAPIRRLLGLFTGGSKL